jgi:DNA-binding MarR family transcriptional regulator
MNDKQAMKKTFDKAAGRTLSAETMQSWLSVVRVYHLCDAVLSQRLAALGLKLPEHELMANLLRHPGLTQQQLAQRCFVAKSGISMLVTRMVDAGRVQRQADAVDARIWRLTLTPAGRALAERAQQVQAGVIAAMTAGSSPAEQKVIAAAMERASATLEGMRSARAG